MKSFDWSVPTSPCQAPPEIGLIQPPVLVITARLAVLAEPPEPSWTLVRPAILPADPPPLGALAGVLNETGAKLRAASADGTSWLWFGSVGVAACALLAGAPAAPAPLDELLLLLLLLVLLLLPQPARHSATTSADIVAMRDLSKSIRRATAPIRWRPTTRRYHRTGVPLG